MAVPVGAGLALVIAPMLGTLVYGVSSRDPVSLAVAVVGAVLAGIAGTYVPVLRAANANIVKILRGD
jgi:ABC-type antimicrobial peptide transport system permease subunit